MPSSAFAILLVPTAFRWFADNYLTVIQGASFSIKKKPTKLIFEGYPSYFIS
jgi:hypothetical protein